MPNSVILSQQIINASGRKRDLEETSNSAVIDSVTMTKQQTSKLFRGENERLIDNSDQLLIYGHNMTRNNMRSGKINKLSLKRLLMVPITSVLFILSIGLINHQVASSSASSVSLLSPDTLLGDQQSSFISQLQQHQQPQSLSSSSSSFDPSTYKSIDEAIRGHPELREFAALCELEGVKEIISMDKTPLTVFAPIDKSMADLLVKSKSRSINLIELAKHHIVQGFVLPDENTKYPLQFTSYSLLSPLYLNQVQLSANNQQQRSNSQAVQQQQHFVNNAKILATHLIPIDSDNYQTLHIIDQVLEFAYVNRRAQLRGPSSNGAGAKKSTTVKKGLTLDDLQQPTEQLQQQAAFDYYERFADLQANQASVDLYHTRVYRATDMQHKLTLSRDELNLERLARTFRQHPELRGKLYQVNESSSMNTYFLPLNTQELDALLEGGSSWSRLTLEAHIVPDQVLFTRVMGLGQTYGTLFDRDSQTHRVSLSLAKSLPEQQDSTMDNDSNSGSRKFLATPLLLQATCSHTSQQQPPSTESANNNWRTGLTNAELLVANIPLSNGVLHLIKRPILITETNVLDYLNDNGNQLSNVVSALGSRSAPQQQSAVQFNPNVQQTQQVAKVNRFRELLARERQMLATFSMDNLNKTILAPSDQAFQRLRFDLRALVQNDESLIPRHWDASYRQDLLERLVKRHVILQQTITSDLMQAGYQTISDNGKVLNFGAVAGGSNELQVECDGTQARILHRDLIGTNGVLHIIDRVLGEEQETVYSLLKSILLRYKNHLDSVEQNNSYENELGQLIQTNIKNQHQEMISSSTTATQNHPNSINSQTQESSSSSSDKSQNNNPELALISRSIGQYLDELSNKHQLEQLATSVNISYQLAKLTSMAEGLDDWNDKFKQVDRSFTYFVPSDLAWIRLQQAQPELYKPLMYFLGQSSSNSGDQQDLGSTSTQLGTENGINSLTESSSFPAAGSSLKSPRSSESSHRLRQILERHLVVNKKIAKKDLSQLESLQTLGATLRLVEAPQNQQLTATFDGSNNQPASAYAALHSITNQPINYQQAPAATGSGSRQLKSLKLESSSANIIQSNEASNGFVYIIDNVLILPEDSDYIVQTSAAPAISSTMSSLLGGHNSAILDFIQSLLSPSPFNMSAQSILALIGTLLLAIALLLVIAMVLIVRRHRQNKLNRHQQLESGLTSSSSANSGSTSTTKSL